MSLSSGGSAGGELEQVSAEEAIVLASGGSVLVDVRELDEWEAGHSPFARHIPMSQIEQRVGELPEDATLLVVCHSGNRSLHVARALVHAGYDAVNVVGGMTAWLAAGGAIVAEGTRSPHV